MDEHTRNRVRDIFVARDARFESTWVIPWRKAIKTKNEFGRLRVQDRQASQKRTHGVMYVTMRPVFSLHVLGRERDTASQIAQQKESRFVEMSRNGASCITQDWIQPYSALCYQTQSLAECIWFVNFCTRAVALWPGYPVDRINNEISPPFSMYCRTGERSVTEL
jgi:hypothetical protein